MPPNELLAHRIQRHHRLLDALDVEVHADLVSERARSHDLSAGGMFVDSAQDYLPGMLVRLTFDLGGRPFDLVARVIHVRPQVGFGAAFVDLDPSGRDHILRYVHTVRATREAQRLVHSARR